MSIPGLKNLRLLAVQPVALLPYGGVNMEQGKQYFMELTLDSGFIMNVPVTKKIHDEYLLRMKEQGTPIEQRVSAREEMPTLTNPTAPKERYVPVTGPVDIEAELRKAVQVCTPGADPYEPTSRLPEPEKWTGGDVIVGCSRCHETHAVTNGETPCAPGAWREVER